jgi:hypothetical protein
MDSIKNFYYSFHQPNDDDFYKKGYLSKEQFQKSGDQLTKTGWKWNRSQNENNLFEEINKQYLSLNGNSN